MHSASKLSWAQLATCDFSFVDQDVGVEEDVLLHRPCISRVGICEDEIARKDLHHSIGGPDPLSELDLFSFNDDGLLLRPHAEMGPSVPPQAWTMPSIKPSAGQLPLGTSLA